MKDNQLDASLVRRLEAEMEELRQQIPDARAGHDEYEASFARWERKKRELDEYRASLLPPVPPGGPHCTVDDCGQLAAYKITWFDGSGEPECGYHAIDTLYHLGSSAAPLFPGFPRDPLNPQKKPPGAAGLSIRAVGAAVAGPVLGTLVWVVQQVVTHGACRVPVLNLLWCEASGPLINPGPNIGLLDLLALPVFVAIATGILWRVWVRGESG